QTRLVTNAGRHTAGVAAPKEIARSDVLRGAQAGLDANCERAQPRGRQRGPCRICGHRPLQTKIDAEGGNGMRKSMLRKAVILGLLLAGCATVGVVAAEMPAPVNADQIKWGP